MKHDYESDSWSQTMTVAEKYLKQGKAVHIMTVNFGEDSVEHAAVEYEVYVDFA